MYSSILRQVSKYLAEEQQPPDAFALAVKGLSREARRKVFELLRLVDDEDDEMDGADEEKGEFKKNFMQKWLRLNVEQVTFRFIFFQKACVGCACGCGGCCILLFESFYRRFRSRYKYFFSMLLLFSFFVISRYLDSGRRR